MKRLAIISTIMFSISGASYASPCDENIFIAKVCISSEVMTPVPWVFPCEDQAKHPHIIKELVSAFRLAPPWFQSQLCNIDSYTIISTKADGNYTGWSNAIPNKSRIVGMNKDRLDEGFDLKKMRLLTSWGWNKLKSGTQVPKGFGFDLAGDVPGVATLFILAHELGHNFTSPNNRNLQYAYFDDCTRNELGNKTKCSPFKVDQFGFFSWIIMDQDEEDIYRGQIRSAEDQKLRKFYIEAKDFSLEELDVFYQNLFQSSFATSFALASPEEDFCEAFALTVLGKVMGKLNFTFLSGKSIDVLQRLQNPNNKILKSKLEFVESRIKEFESGQYW